MLVCKRTARISRYRRPIGRVSLAILSLSRDRLVIRIMRALFRLEGTRRRHPEVACWFEDHSGPLGELARHWYRQAHALGEDVAEVMHDGQPTLCVEGAAFAYVDAYTAHANLGFFQGAELPDPAGLLEGKGRFMRHVKLRVECDVDEDALKALIEAAYRDIKERLRCHA